MFHIPNEELKKTLLASGFIDEAQFEAAKEEADKTDRDILNILVEHGDISEEYLAEIMADYFEVKYVALDKLNISEDVLGFVPEQIAKSKKVLPFEVTSTELKVAMEDPGDLDTINFLEKQTGREIIPYITTSSNLREALGSYKKSISSDFTKIICFIKFFTAVSAEVVAS